MESRLIGDDVVWANSFIQKDDQFVPPSVYLDKNFEPERQVHTESELEDGTHYELKEIVDSKLDCWYRVPLCYKVEWLGYEDYCDEDCYSWFALDELDHAEELVQEFQTGNSS